MSEFKRFKNPIYCPSSHHNGVRGIQNVIIAWVDSIEIAALEQANEEIELLKADNTLKDLKITIQYDKIKKLEAKLSIAVEALEDISKIKYAGACVYSGSEDMNFISRKALEKLRGGV